MRREHVRAADRTTCATTFLVVVRSLCTVGPTVLGLPHEQRRQRQRVFAIVFPFAICGASGAFSAALNPFRTSIRRTQLRVFEKIRLL